MVDILGNVRTQKDLKSNWNKLESHVHFSLINSAYTYHSLVGGLRWFGNSGISYFVTF